MIEKYISKANLKKVLGRLLKDSDLVAPVNAYGEIVFQEVDSVNDIKFEYENCLNAPKDYVLLNDESLVKYDLKKSKMKLEKNPSNRQIVIFGSRACDTKAIGLLDKFYKRKFEDPIYFKKRKDMFIITLVCKSLWQNCFCTSTESGPCLEDGFDVQLVDTGDGYLLEAWSSKGKNFVKKFSSYMTNVNADIKRKKEEAINKAISSKKMDFQLKKVYKNLNELKTKDEMWQELSLRCQNCGGCLLICPTCSCFYVVDKKINGKEYERVRSLDACYYEGFTRMAGDYNPISPRSIMMRRKFYHKLWQQIDEFEQAGCTGCGRCNDICPGNINWLEEIKKIEKYN